MVPIQSVIPAKAGTALVTSRRLGEAGMKMVFE
jgi:hypothetical protein